MTTDQPSSSTADDRPTGEQTPVGGSSTPPAGRRRTRASAVWVATAAALILLILLIIFMLQNSSTVVVHFLGLTGTVPLGVALLIAAVGGGVLVAIAGVARVTQLRLFARRSRRGHPRD